MKQVFAIIYDSIKKSSLPGLCADFSAELKDINPNNINSTVGSLMGLNIPPDPDTPEIPAVYAPPEILIFSGFTDNELERFLNEYKENNIPPIKLKGTITPYNLNWTIYRLIKDYEEH